jgi:uracil-DNA glycosylase family 4
LELEKELRDIFVQLRSRVTAYQEIGLDPPPLSAEVLEYLDHGITSAPSSSGRLELPVSLDALATSISGCERCKLYKGRNHLVFGEGLPTARLVFVGEGPGYEEDMVGRPFVGEAGRLLTRIIGAMGLTREEVYICNVVKCRPPRNRDPEKDEIEACMPFLEKQLNSIKPEVICVLGRIAGQALLGKDFMITSQRGTWHSYSGIPVMPTFHPAYILRNPSRERQLKGLVWKDIQEIMLRLSLEVKRNG